VVAQGTMGGDLLTMTRTDDNVLCRVINGRSNASTSTFADLLMLGRRARELFYPQTS